MDYKTGILTVLLLLSLLSNFLIWKVGSDRQRDLESQVAQLQALEKRSTVVRGVSRRMEEIAFQQKLVSDNRREEALEQARIAQQMTRLSEQERQRALKAEREATASELSAREAYETAERQRRVAELQRVVAETSKRMADTLSYISLGHSLGLRAVSLFHAGKTSLSRLMAYASFSFVRDYHGDLYHPSVYEALVKISQSTITQSLQNGTISALEPVPGHDGRLVTVSILGDIYQHEATGTAIKSRCLLSDRRYKFKGLYIDAAGTIYALSRTGHLVVVKHGEVVTVDVPSVSSPSFLAVMKSGKELLIVGKGAMATFDMQQYAITGTVPISFDATCVSRLDAQPLIFDRQGCQHMVSSLQQITTKKVPVKGVITAFAYSHGSGISAYGTLSGTIYTIAPDGRQSQLVGHRSRVSKLKMDYYSLYSTSYDGTLRLWKLTSDKLDPLTLISSSRWMTDFAISAQRDRGWAVTDNGNLMEQVVLPETMGEIVRRSLTRDFTPEEWRHYVSKNIKQRKLID